MARILKIPTFSDKSGDLSVVEKISGFNIKRVYYIYNFNNITRAKHKHKRTKQILICLSGKIQLKVVFKNKTKIFNLEKPTVGVYLDPQDWHEIVPIKKNSIILVLASTFFKKKDYFNEK
jgi:hypothetical protein